MSGNPQMETSYINRGGIPLPGYTPSFPVPPIESVVPCPDCTIPTSQALAQTQISTSINSAMSSAAIIRQEVVFNTVNAAPSSTSINVVEAIQDVLPTTPAQTQTKTQI
jgi:hypothetical protein